MFTAIRNDLVEDMDQLAQAVRGLLTHFERVGGESDKYLLAVANLRALSPCDNPELNDLPAPTLTAKTR